MKTAIESNEKVIKEGLANMQRGMETVGGKLYLTTQRLIFESHKFNIQTGNTEFLLQDISNTTPCWTKFLNLIPLAPNSLSVSVSDNEHRFVLFGRKNWKVAIDNQRSRASD